jgi:IMP dehydrogenase
MIKTNNTSHALTYDDVLLVPQYSDIRSRSEIDTSIDLGKNLVLELPIIASPMDTISEAPMANAMSKHGATAVLHRYSSLEAQHRMLTVAKDASAENTLTVGAAIGTTGDFLERACALVAAGTTFLCIDVAHGHHILVKDALQALRTALGDDIHIMAGNVATLEGVNDLADWGADSVRCNIGGGSICSTRIQTGHGMPGLQTVMDCAKTDRDVAIIADGGIRNSGDIVKAIAAGADAVMCGSLLAGTNETPGKIIEGLNGARQKVYRGMASKEAQVEWRGKYSSFEGVSSTVPYRGGVKHILADLERGIRSGLSYSGARNISELHSIAQFVEQSSAGMSEGRTHIVGRKW